MKKNTHALTGYASTARSKKPAAPGAGSTRRQQKHDLLLTFMAQSRNVRSKPPRKRSSFLKTLLSVFL